VGRPARPPLVRLALVVVTPPPEGSHHAFSNTVAWHGADSGRLDARYAGHRARLGWPQKGHDAEGEAVRVPLCAGPACIVFAGGYLVDMPACVRVIVRSGEREALARVSVGAPGPCASR